MGYRKTAREAGSLRWIAVFVWKFIAFVTLLAVLYQRSNELNASPTRVRRQATDESISTPEVIDPQSPTTASPRATTINETTTIAQSDGTYPDPLFTIDQIRKGGFILYAFGMFYMFCALAIVCDEFFVPALEVLTTKMKISDDVAGATMMAAGGSAPELFTSVIGVFFAKSDVGIGTIVGSAVFNVLFVIGMCALFSKEILQLTWWPLFRDCTFYIISLAVLIYAFLDTKIDWWESLLLLICYAAYVIFMKYNVIVEKLVKSKLSKGGTSTESISVKVCPADGEVSKNGDPTKEVSKEQVSKSLDHDQVGAPAPSSGGGFHPGWKLAKSHVAHLQRDEENNDDGATPDVKLLTLAQVSEEVLRQKNASYLRCRRNCSMRALMKVNNPRLTRQAFERTQTMDEINGQSGAQKVRRTRSWQPPSKNQATMQQAGRTLSTDKLTANAPSLSVAADASNGAENAQQMPAISEEKQNGNGHANGTLSVVPPVSAGGNQVSDTTLNVSNDSEEDADFLDMSWPQGDWKKQAIYLFLLPITGPLYLVVPDVRRPGKEKWVVVTFINSILWIAVYSYLMVWWADVLGGAFGISPPVMGLTFLAAGTSVPDLITSVIVAKKGLGDMAVSSSIGSNIFDITVGLPLPWLIRTAIDAGVPVQVRSEGMVCNISLLFIMLLAVFSGIACYKWRMTKGLGAGMFILYGVFLAFALTLETGKVECPIQVGG